MKKIFNQYFDEVVVTDDQLKINESLSVYLDAILQLPQVQAQKSRAEERQ